MEPRLPRGRAKAVLHMRNAFSNKKGNAGWERKGSGFLSLVGLSERRSSFWLLCPPRVHSRCSSHVLPRVRKQGVSSTQSIFPRSPCQGDVWSPKQTSAPAVSGCAVKADMDHCAGLAPCLPLSLLVTALWRRTAQQPCFTDGQAEMLRG